MGTDRSGTGKETAARSPDAPIPFVSIVVPVYNDPEGIEDTLGAVTDQTYPAGRYEVVVVDNGSTDRTRSVVERFATRFERVTLAIEDEIQGSYAARNRGIERANGEILGFVDADVTVRTDWLERAVDRLQSSAIDYLGCAVSLTVPGSGSLAGRYDGSSAFPVEQFLEESRFAPTCGLFVRRAVIEDVGAFDARLVSGGDREFGERVHAAGWTQGFAPEAPITHPARTSVRALLRKAHRVGRGTAQLKRHHPERYGNPLLVLINPKPFIPHSFDGVRSTVTDWDRCEPVDKAGFYLLHYGTSIARGWGQLTETLRGQSRESPSKRPLLARIGRP